MHEYEYICMNMSLFRFYTAPVLISCSPCSHFIQPLRLYYIARTLNPKGPCIHFTQPLWSYQQTRAVNHTAPVVILCMDTHEYIEY